MTEQAQAVPGHEHTAAVLDWLTKRRASWTSITWLLAVEDDNGTERHHHASTPSSVITDVLEAAAELGLLVGYIGRGDQQRTAPTTVRDAARRAAEQCAQQRHGRANLTEYADAAIDTTWQHAHRLLGGMISYEVSCLRCVTQLDKLAAERAAGIEEGHRAAAEHVRRYADQYAPAGAPEPTAALRRHLQLAAGIAAEVTEPNPRDLPMRDGRTFAEHLAEAPSRIPAEPAIDTPDTIRAIATRTVIGPSDAHFTIPAENLERGTGAADTWPGPDLAEIGKWAQDFTTDEEGAPGSVSQLDEHIFEEWGRTVAADSDRDRYNQLAILAAWIVATMRELRLREARKAIEARRES